MNIERIKFNMKGPLLTTIIYFNIFDHPLNLKEIQAFASEKLSLDTVRETLDELVEDEIIFKKGDFYSLANEMSTINKRIDANQRAKKKMKIALRNSKYIAHLPFVRGVFLSGTIAKGIMHSDSDIDFFIITDKNRLWVTKLALKIFKILFLFNSRKHFCYNYLLSNENLVIEERNLYTATELITLIPTYNYDLYKEFVSVNSWYKDYYPNSILRNDSMIVSDKKSTFQKLSEKLLDNSIGDWINSTFLKYVQKKYEKEFADVLTEEERAIALRTTNEASKVHPRHYQKRFLQHFENCLVGFEKKHNLVLRKTAMDHEQDFIY